MRALPRASAKQLPSDKKLSLIIEGIPVNYSLKLIKQDVETFMEGNKHPKNALLALIILAYKKRQFSTKALSDYMLTLFQNEKIPGHQRINLFAKMAELSKKAEYYILHKDTLGKLKTLIQTEIANISSNHYKKIADKAYTRLSSYADEDYKFLPRQDTELDFTDTDSDKSSPDDIQPEPVTPLASKPPIEKSDGTSMIRNCHTFFLGSDNITYPKIKSVADTNLLKAHRQSLLELLKNQEMKPYNQLVLALLLTKANIKPGEVKATIQEQGKNFESPKHIVDYAFI